MSKKSKKLSPEELAAEHLERELKSAREEHISDPTYTFKVGEEVKYGVTDHAHIVEIIDGGRIYKVHVRHTTRDGTSESDTYLTWIRLLPYRKPKDAISIPKFLKEDNFRVQYSQSDISSLFTYAYHFGVKMDTEYQRPLVWELSDKIALIKSIFNNIDIGKFVFIRRDYNEHKLYEILDGKQRLNTLMEFRENRFRYEGLLFTELNFYDQNHFRHYPVNIGRSEPMDKTAVYEYFLKLNTTGRPQSQEHLDFVNKLLQEETLKYNLAKEI